MSTLRLYLPALVIAGWAILLLIFDFTGNVTRAVAWLSIAVAFTIQITEARRQHARRGRKQDD